MSGNLRGLVNEALTTGTLEVLVHTKNPVRRRKARILVVPSENPIRIGLCATREVMT